MPISDKDVDAIVAKLSIRNSRARQTSSSKKKRFVCSLYINLYVILIMVIMFNKYGGG